MFIIALIIYAVIYRKHKYKERERDQTVPVGEIKRKFPSEWMNTCGFFGGNFGLGLGEGGERGTVREQI